MMMLIGPRHSSGAHNYDCATGVARSDEGCFSVGTECVDSWTPGPKPFCHRHPTGPHPSGLLWTPAESFFDERQLRLGGRTVLVGTRHALLEPELAGLVDPQAVLAELQQVGALPVRGEAHAALAAGADLERLEVVHVLDRSLGRHDHGARLLLAADAGEARTPGLRVARAGAADQGELAHDIGLDQPVLLEHRVGGAADQRAEVLQEDAGTAMGEVGSAVVIVLEAAVGEERA